MRRSSVESFCLCIGVLAAALGLAFAAPVGAQRDPASCGFLSTQEEAQAAFETGALDAAVVDAVGDGIACEDLPSGAGPRDRVTCGFFSTQEDAQAALEAGRLDPVFGDGDGDGVACEDLPSASDGGGDGDAEPSEVSGSSGGTIRLPNTGTGAAAHDRLAWLPLLVLILAMGGAARGMRRRRVG